MAPHGLRFGGVALTRGDLQHSGDGFDHPDPMCRDRLPTKSQDFAGFGQKVRLILGEMLTHDPSYHLGVSVQNLIKI